MKTNTVDGVYITQDPVSCRSMLEGKYDKLFRAMKFDDSLVCKSEQAARISQSLRVFLRREGKPGRVRSTSDYQGTGTGRVWLLREVRGE